jgi:hypothetical protein
MSITRGTHRHAAKVKLREEPPTFKGLCCTCIFATECANAACAEVPVVHCEEFDDRIASPLGTMGTGVMTGLRPRKDSRKKMDVDPELKGLCINCDNRKICKHPKPVGGVWYCEEYR